MIFLFIVNVGLLSFVIVPLIAHLVGPLDASEGHVPERGREHGDERIGAEGLVEVVTHALEVVVVLLDVALQKLVV